MNASLHRILMTADTVGGVWTYAVDLCRELAARDIEVVLATMGGRLNGHQRAEFAALGDRVELAESDFLLEWMDDPWDDVAAAGEWLLDLARIHSPDVIHLNGYAHAALPWPAPTLVVAHSCVYSWWRAVRRGAPPESWHRYHTAVRRGLEHADLVVAPTLAMLASLEHNYGCTTNGRVIHNGRARLRRPPNGAPPKEPFILSVGRLWDEAKNSATLARIAPALAWPVRLAGDTQPPQGGAPLRFPHVELLGRRSAAELATEYERAAIYALPARYEPFGLSILEAAQAGCTLVLGDLPSLRELWSGAAVFVHPNDPAAWREALATLIAQPARRAALGYLAAKRAERFTPRRMSAGYRAAYTELISAYARLAPEPSASFA